MTVILVSCQFVMVDRHQPDLNMQNFDITTKRLLFRRPVGSDLPFYTQYCLSDRTRFVGGPFTKVQAFEKLASMIGHWELRGFGRFVFLERETKRPLGHFGALQLCLSEPPEITWTLWNEEDEGKGFATEAGTAFKSHALGAFGFSSLVAHVHRDNVASRCLAERLGGELDLEAVPPSWLPESVLYRFCLTA